MNARKAAEDSAEVRGIFAPTGDHEKIKEAGRKEAVKLAKRARKEKP